MTYTIRYRNKLGEVDFEIVEADSRAAVFPILKEKGINPISITEGNTQKRSSKKGKVNINLGSKKTFLISTILFIAFLSLVYFLCIPSNTKKENIKKEVVSTQKVESKEKSPNAKKVSVAPSTNSKTNVIRAVVPAKKEENVKLNFTAVTNSSGEVMERWRTPDGKTHARLVPPKPLFDNVIDQTLSLVLSVPKGHTLPPMPGLGPNATKEFAEALKKPIVINEDDPEDVKRAKLLVQAGREAIFDQLETGKSVNEIIAEHCAAVNDNAELHNTVNSEYRKLLAEGDLEGAETYRQEANKILEKSGAEPVQQHGSTSRRKSQQKGSN